VATTTKVETRNVKLIISGDLVFKKVKVKEVKAK